MVQASSTSGSGSGSGSSSIGGSSPGAASSSGCSGEAGSDEQPFLLPLMTLSKVKLPTESVPLQIFEPRYR